MEQMHPGQADRGGRAPPVIVIASPVLSAGLLTLARRMVPVLLTEAALTATLLDRLRPPAVVLALFCPVNDTMRMLDRLQGTGYRGRVLVLSPPLPDVAMVRRELERAAPGLRLRLVEVDDLQMPAPRTR